LNTSTSPLVARRCGSVNRSLGWPTGAHDTLHRSEGLEWLHEIKFDDYRMHARLDRGHVGLLTRTGLDWTQKYPPIAVAVASLGVRQGKRSVRSACR
jgi:hypothetical protein